MTALPPGLQSISSHTFGTLFLQITNLKTSTPLTHFQPQFLGQPESENIDRTNTVQRLSLQSIAQYNILTNAWQFYMYLSDMENLSVIFTSSQNMINKRGADKYYGKVKLCLKPVRDIMKRQFDGGDLMRFEDGVQVEIRDENRVSIGTAKVRCWTQFDKQVHDDIKDLIDLGSMVVFEGISPITSQTQLPREPPLQTSTALSNPSTIPHQVSIQSDPHQYSIQLANYDIKSRQKQKKDEKKQSDQEQYRIMEQDIDKLIQEMQARPYDCSRYQEQDVGSSQGTRVDNHGNSMEKVRNQKNGFLDTHKYANSYVQEKDMVNTQLGINSFTRNSAFKYNNTIRLQQTQASMKNSYARPPSHSPPPRQPPLPHQQTIITKSPKLLKTNSLDSKPTSMNAPISQGYLQIKIHEMLVSIGNTVSHKILSQIIQPCYTLRLYLNQDQEEYYAGQGIKQGQVINFNQALKVRNIGQLNTLRFVISDDYGRIQAQGVFDLSRLYGSQMRKGVFSVPLISVANNNAPSRLKTNQNKLQEIVPVHRSLRIQAELVQQIEMVQIYMNISKVNIASTMLRYKIPLTKQTIESVGHSHTNIFPHSCSPHIPDKLILQFWQNNENIGQSEISLKNIKNTNSNVLNTSIQPIYLYDGRKQIRNILEGDRVVGDFMLTLCFGTVRHMQGLLVGAIQENKEKELKQKAKVNVGFDQRLGVFVKEKPVLNEISVQVEIQQQNNTQKQQKHANTKKVLNQPSFGDQSMISHTSHNEFMDASMISFAKHNQQEEHISHFITKQFSKTSPLNPTLALPTLTQRLFQNLLPLLTPLLPLIAKIKQLSKPHLLYNFIQVSTLQQILCKNLGLPHHNIQQILKLILFPKQNMVNINILYDFITCIQLDGKIKDKFFSDQMIVVGGLRLLYGADCGGRRKDREGLLLEDGMDFGEMVSVFRDIGVKLVLHQFKVLQRFMTNYKTKEQARNLKEAVMRQIQSQKVQKIKEGFYEHDILKQIYGDDNSSMNESSYSNSQIQNLNDTSNYNKTMKSCSPPKFNINQTKQTKKQPQFSTSKQPIKQAIAPASSIAHTYRLTIQGIQQVLQSLSCVLDPLPPKISIKLEVEQPIKMAISYRMDEKTKQIELKDYKGQLTDIDGKVFLMSGDNAIAQVAFSLIRQVKSLYALKMTNGQFCGLLHLLLQ